MFVNQIIPTLGTCLNRYLFNTYISNQHQKMSTFGKINTLKYIFSFVECWRCQCKWQNMSMAPQRSNWKSSFSKVVILGTLKLQCFLTNFANNIKLLAIFQYRSWKFLERLYTNYLSNMYTYALLQKSLTRDF